MRFDDIMISFDITISSLIDKKKDFEFSYRNLLTIFQCKRSKINKLLKHANLLDESIYF